MITLHKLPESSCNLIVVFSTLKSWMSYMLIFVWPFGTFKLAQGQVALRTHQFLSNCMHYFVTLLRYSPHQNLRQVWYWLLSDLLAFWTRSCSNGSILQLLVNRIMPQNLPSSCCNFISSDVLLIRISAMFDVDLCVTFLNFQYNPRSYDLVNAITPQKLHIPFCSFTGMYFTNLANCYVDLYATFWTFRAAQGQAAL